MVQVQLLPGSCQAVVQYTVVQHRFVSLSNLRLTVTSIQLD